MNSNLIRWYFIWIILLTLLLYVSYTHHQNFLLRRRFTCGRHIIINQQLRYICYFIWQRHEDNVRDASWLFISSKQFHDMTHRLVSVNAKDKCLYFSKNVQVINLFHLSQWKQRKHVWTFFSHIEYMMKI